MYIFWIFIVCWFREKTFTLILNYLVFVVKMLKNFVVMWQQDRLRWVAIYICVLCWDFLQFLVSYFFIIPINVIWVFDILELHKSIIWTKTTLLLFFRSWSVSRITLTLWMRNARNKSLNERFVHVDLLFLFQNYYLGIIQFYW
jgi:hypothetical protein